MHADREIPLVRAPRARVGPPCLFESNLSAQQPTAVLPPLPPRRESACSTGSNNHSYVSSDARDRNGSVSSVCSNLSEFVNRRGSNDSVFGFLSSENNFSDRAERRGSGIEETGAESKGAMNSNFFRKRKPRSLRNSFESLQLALAPDNDENPSQSSSSLCPPPPPPSFSATSFSTPTKFNPSCELTSQLLNEGTHDHVDCSCSESEDEFFSPQSSQPPLFDFCQHHQFQSEHYEHFPQQQQQPQYQTLQQQEQYFQQYWKEQGLGQVAEGYSYEGEQQYFSGLLSPISEGSSSSSSLSDYSSPLPSPLPSPAELSQRLWQGLLTPPSSMLNPSMQPRRVRRSYKKRTQGCNCEKSKCLKLYCECFAKQAVCGPECNCKGCMNTPAEMQLREKAIQVSLDRSTTAFFRSPETKLEHKGCRCKKSQCRKNYCECFSASRSCTPECRCTDCGNVHGAKLPQLRRLSSGGYEVLAITAEEVNIGGECDQTSRSSSGGSLAPRPPPPPPVLSNGAKKGPPPPPPPPPLDTTPQRRSPPPPPPLPSSSQPIPNLSSLVLSKLRKEKRDSDLLSPTLFWPLTPKGGGEDEELESPFGKFSPEHWNEGDVLADSWRLSPETTLAQSSYCPDLLMDALATAVSR